MASLSFTQFAKQAGGTPDQVKVIDQSIPLEKKVSEKEPSKISSLVDRFKEKAVQAGKNVVEAVKDPLHVIPERLNDLTPDARQTGILSGRVKDASEEEKQAAKDALEVTALSLSPGESVANSLKNSVKPLESAVKPVTSAIKSGIEKTKQVVESAKVPKVIQGAVQTTKEFGERIPRVVNNVKEAITEAGDRASRIKTATPATQKAIKSNLDERIINTVNDADDVTRQAYRDVLDIAEESEKKIGTKKQPNIVGGDLASKQFDVINTQKSKVGEEIGERVKELSKDTQVDLTPSKQSLEDMLSENGISKADTETGTRLDFKGTSFTPAERTKVEELYKLATELGDDASPLQIYKRDQLFSKLQREAKFEGIGDILIDTPEGKKSLFSAFRDVYSKALDEVAPEDLRALRSEYNGLKKLTDDIEDSIFKTPNFNITKSTDPAEFAKINLRRIFGESQSSPVFEAIADAMDAASRGLGYNGASPKTVAEFAQEMRKLFPDSIPKTGFSGGIRMGVMDVAEKVINAGTPALKDQQKALRELLEEIL